MKTRDEKTIQNLKMALDGLEKARTAFGFIRHDKPLWQVPEVLLGQVFILRMAVAHWLETEEKGV